MLTNGVQLFVEKKENGKWKLEDQFFPGTNLVLFSILGCTKNKFAKPLGSPRGLPNDIDSDTKKLIDDIESNVKGYDHSYFTAQEIIQYDWDSYTISPVEFLVTDEMYEKWLKKGKPDNFPFEESDMENREKLGDRRGPKFVNNEEMEKYVSMSKNDRVFDGIMRNDSRPYATKINANFPTKLVVIRFLNSIKKYQEEGLDLNNVRFVFFFA